MLTFFMATCEYGLRSVARWEKSLRRPWSRRPGEYNGEGGGRLQIADLSQDSPKLLAINKLYKASHTLQGYFVMLNKTIMTFAIRKASRYSKIGTALNVHLYLVGYWNYCRRTRLLPLTNQDLTLSKIDFLNGTVNAMRLMSGGYGGKCLTMHIII